MRRVNLAVVFVLVFGLLFSSGAYGEALRFSPRPNKAHLIKWRLWGKEAFSEAKQKDKLILLSLSAVWCHWCHVMDETTYSDLRVIELLNREFIPIRVDSDMRPDIDAIYNQGGWPSTVILTPNGEILTGGTYIPPEKMLYMLTSTLEFYRKNKDAIKERLKELRADEEKTKEVKAEEDYVVVEKIIRFLKEEFDDRYGGFDIGQKFPRPEILDFLLFYYSKKPDKEIKRIIIQTLDAMAMSALYDHLEGGFFRYSVKRDWSRPHYEKMLDVNSGLLKNYIMAYGLFGEKAYLETANGVFKYLITNLYDPSKGLFYGSQDADEVYYKARDRNGLNPPRIDRTFYADKNSFALSAIIKYAEFTSSKQADSVIKKMGNELIRRFYKENEGIYHYINKDGIPRVKGLLLDNVAFGLCMLDLYEYTGDKNYLSKALATGRLLKDMFLGQDGLLKDNINTQVVNPVTTGMLKRYLRIKGNYIALVFFARLSPYDKGYDEIIKTLKSVLSRDYERFNFTSSIFAKALFVLSNKTYEFKIVTGKAGLRNFLNAINRVYLPSKKIEVFLLGKDNERLKKEGFPPRQALYICQGKRCFPPLLDDHNLLERIKDITGR